MTPFTSGVLTAALLCSLPIGVVPVAQASASMARAPLVLTRTVCDDNGRCYETGDPDRGFGQDDGDGGFRRRRDPDNAGSDDAGPPPRRDRRDLDRDDDPPPRQRRRFDDPDSDDAGPPRGFDRRPPRGDYRDRRDDDE